jgi:hypothetical protein
MQGPIRQSAPDLSLPCRVICDVSCAPDLRRRTLFPVSHWVVSPWGPLRHGAGEVAVALLSMEQSLAAVRAVMPLLDTLPCVGRSLSGLRTRVAQRARHDGRSACSARRSLSVLRTTVAQRAPHDGRLAGVGLAIVLYTKLALEAVPTAVG